MTGAKEVCVCGHSRKMHKEPPSRYCRRKDCACSTYLQAHAAVTR